VNMVKEADKNGDGEVREITFNLCQDWLSWVYWYDGQTTGKVNEYK
jgi:hypothetical protein